MAVYQGRSRAPKGDTGEGVPAGGTTGQLLKKASATDYDTEWADVGAGTGDVVGPSSAVDNDIAVFDGITGKLIKDGNYTIVGVLSRANHTGTQLASTISDFDTEVSNNTDVAANTTHRTSDGSDHTFIDQDVTNGSSPVFDEPTVDGIQFNLTPTITSQEGLMHWNSEDGTLEVGMPGGVVNLQVGQENLVRVTNSSGVDMLNGDVVYVSGALGSKPTITLADADSILTSGVIGVLTEDIANNNNGYVTTYGLVRDIDTSLFTVGQTLWLSQTAGQLTATRPTQPAIGVSIATCIVSNATEGVILVNTRIVENLTDLSDTLISSQSDNDFIYWDNASSVWKSKALTSSDVSDFDTEVSNNSDVAANTTHRTSDGKDHSDVVLNNTHRTSNGTDHTYINQDVTTTADVTFNMITSSNSIYVNDWDDYVVNGSQTNKSYVKNESVLSFSPFAAVTWHDLYSLHQWGAPTYESYDGSTWTTGTVDDELFEGKEGESINVINVGTIEGSRWTWYNSTFGWSEGHWLVLGIPYNNPQPVINVLFESSADGITWTTRNTSQIDNTDSPRFLRVSDYGGDDYTRLTLTVDSGTGLFNLSTIRLLTTRWGSQGRGSEYSIPYDWNVDKEIFFENNINVTGNITVSGTVDSVDIGTDVPLNTTHRTSDGSDHGFIDQDVTSGSSPTFDGTNITGINASNVSVDAIGTPTYTDVQKLIDVVGSSGKLTGGAITDNGDGTVAVASGTGMIKATDSETATLNSFDWSANSSVTLTDNSANYICIDYNAGTPIISSGTTVPTDHNTIILLGEVYREGTDLHIVTAGQVIGNFPSKVFWKSIDVYGKFQRQSGMIISETGTRNIATTAGAIYAGLTKTSISALDTSVTDTFKYYYRDGVGGWTEVASQTQISNQYYDDGSGTLATLDGASGWRPADYGVHWVYLDIDGDLFVIYGQGSYTLTDAQDVQPPSSIPDILSEVGGIIGKIIIQKDATTFYSVQSAFDATFSPTATSDHNELSGLQGGTADEYYHLTNTEYTDLTDSGDSTLHYHSTDRDRANHTGTQTASTISDFQTTVESYSINNVVEDTTPQLGGSLDRNNKSITTVETAGENVVAGDLCYLKSDGKYWKTDASAEATASTDLLSAAATINADATGVFTEFGEYTTSGLTAGSKYYVSETAGEITATAPTTSAAIVRFVGYALSTTVLKFRPDMTYIELE